MLLLPVFSYANPILPNGSLPAVTVTNTPGGGQEYSVTLQVLLLMTLLTFIPAILMMMTAFTRIVVVLGILRQALGLQQVPSNQVIMGISLFMTFFVMSPVFDQIYNDAVQPYSQEKLTFQQALGEAQKPLRAFMLKQTRETDVKTFASMAGVESFDTPQDVPMRILIPAFVTSELKTAFQIGFMLFIPFLIIDLVVASVLMAMGMMMLSPMIISLPFKLMLFVLVDGWNLVLGTLARSF
ncbi:MAG: flagellar type III secretion system pore protein FliP [Pseudomonadota bacterium]|nr:flagellar type III secretion system pore protein FliP [Gallaecimonas pentaromativorans]MED5526679.1 flagellar type III secretion system pore protein FliP [Pseudomonadota bacterium]